MMSELELASSAQATPETHSQFDEEASEGSNKFQHAISAWRNIDYTTLISNLDNTASQIVSCQRDSIVQRKDLANKTKAFRKLDDAAKLVEIRGLLKAYQSFIDLLTTQSKSVNSTFLTTYASLSEAPDPYPLLEASVDSMLVLEDTMPKMARDNERLQKSIKELSTQLENTESRLQAEILSRSMFEDACDKRVADVESSWMAVVNENKNNWAEREKTLEEKIDKQERLLNEVKANFQANQRLDQSHDDNQPSGSVYITNAGADMLHADLERTSARLAQMEAQNEQLRLELAQARSHVSVRINNTPEDDPAYIRVRSENSSLIRKLDASRIEKEELKRDFNMRLRLIEREALLLKQERDALKAKVQRCSDYDQLRQELDILRSIEFAPEDDDGSLIGNSDAGHVSNSEGGTLEKLLFARNKKLGEELTLLRVSHQDLRVKIEELQQDQSQAKSDLEQARLLNEKLENDLANLQSELPGTLPSAASAAKSRYASSAAHSKRGRRLSPTSSIIGGIDPRISGGEPVASGPGILSMVTAQRDRFKAKNAQLEGELAECHRTICQLRQEISALQRDNLNLYEKTRYVSTYNRTGPSASSTSSATFTLNSNPSTVPIAVSKNPGRGMEIYQEAYESKLSPFAQFRGRESARAYRRMTLPERIVYTITRMVIASRASRNLFAGYCLVLHMLVFLSMYWLATANVAQHVTSLVDDARTREYLDRH